MVTDNRIHFGFEVSKMLNEALSNYKELGNPIYFYHVAYPIAKVELDILENVIENFEVIEKYILSFINVSEFSFEDISKLTGIPVNKIISCCKSLQISGLIDSSNKITDLGKKSLQDNKKYSNIKRKMMVLVDGVTGVVLEEGAIYEKFMKEGAVSAFKTVPMLIPESNLTKENFSQFYENIDFSEDDVISTNFDSINKARVDGLFYAPLYLIGFENLKSPLLFKEYKKKLSPVYIFDEYKELIHEKCTVVANKNQKYLTGVLNEIESYYDYVKKSNNFIKKIGGEQKEDDDDNSHIRHITITNKIDYNALQIDDTLLCSDECEFAQVIDQVNGIIFYFTEDIASDDSDNLEENEESEEKEEAKEKENPEEGEEQEEKEDDKDQEENPKKESNDRTKNIEEGFNSLKNMLSDINKEVEMELKELSGDEELEEEDDIL